MEFVLLSNHLNNLFLGFYSLKKQGEKRLLYRYLKQHKRNQIEVKTFDNDFEYMLILKSHFPVPCIVLNGYNHNLMLINKYQVYVSHKLD